MTEEPRDGGTPDPNPYAPGDALAPPARDVYDPGPPPPEGVKEKQPAGLFLLFVTEMWERFSYYGMRALLMLYMVDTARNGMGWTTETAGKIYGGYTGLVYLLPVFGGMLADKLLGTHRSMIIGGIVISLGHFVLALTELSAPGSAGAQAAFFSGLGLVIIGTGFFKPCVSVMVGQLYREGDGRRDAGFTIFYMGINVGAFLAPLVCGWLASKYGWHWGFGAAGVGMVLGLVVYMAFRPRVLRGVGLPPKNADARSAILTTLTSLLIIGLIGAVYIWADRNEKTTLIYTMAIGMGVAAIAAVIWFVSIQEKQDKGPMLALFIVSFFVIFFWYAFEQAGSSMNLFADQRVQRELPESLAFLGASESELKPDANATETTTNAVTKPEEGGPRYIPASWFQSVNPFCILLFAPIFSWCWLFLARKKKEPSTPVKMSFGLLLLGFGFVLMIFAGYYSDGGTPLAEGEQATLVSANWLFGAYTLHTLGELCLSPLGLSLVTKLSAQRFVSLMMGVWFLAPSIAQFIGGFTAAAIEPIEKGEAFDPIIGGQADFWLIFVITSFGAGLLLLLLTPVMKKLMAGRG